MRGGGFFLGLGSRVESMQNTAQEGPRHLSFAAHQGPKPTQTGCICPAKLAQPVLQDPYYRTHGTIQQHYVNLELGGPNPKTCGVITPDRL